ncbi:MAG: serine/threonine-protein kinase [Pyrinomonadaceae bacterium]
MYCPKCKESFEEGSRRFCPNDGARLISEIEVSAGQKEGGFFANLIPKIDAISDLDAALSDPPHFVINEPDEPVSDSAGFTQPDDIFFDLDEMEPEFESETRFVTPVETVSTEPKPIARKVSPYEIPAGHVDLGAGYRQSMFAAEFNENEPESFVGRTVKGRYRVTEFLGGDENGLAYLADDKIVEDKKVLVRILTGDESDEILDSILAEERISLSHFSHPYIARLIDSGEFAGGTDFLISEYVDALSVGDIMSIHGPFHELRAARIIRQVASALNEAHQEGILHRDLRPENLIIDASPGETEQTKLVNFGASNGEPTERNIGYKAPEVLERGVSTAASDIYSLAVIAYEMLTGHGPFYGANAREMVKSQHSGLELKASDVRPKLPRIVDDIFERAFSVNAADRFPKARDFGEAFYTAVAESPQRLIPAVETGDVERTEKALPDEPLPVVAEDGESDDKGVVISTPVLTPATTTSTLDADQPAWKNRSPEPPEVGNARTKLLGGLGILALLALLAFGWYYVVNHPSEPDIPLQTGQVPDANVASSNSPIALNTEMPPQPRDIPQPPNTNFYQNSKQNLKGDLLINFVGFTMYYPKDWKVNGPQEGSTPNARGKFLDISRSTPDGRLREQMLISYYPSKGTFTADADKFPQMVKETNETLKKLLPGYQMVSNKEIKFNGDWQAFEIKFQGGGTSPTGDKLVVWGRRLFIPASRPGVRNGFEITMIATSLAEEIRSVDDVGVKGELASILYSFEPSQNF